MKKSYEKFLEKDKQLSIRPSTVHALKLLAEGKTVNEAAMMVGRKGPNLSTTIKRLRTVFPILSKLVDEIRNEALLEKTATQKTRREKAILNKIKKAESGLYVGSTPPFGAILKDGWFFPKKGKYDTLLEILEGYADGKGPAWLSNKFRMPIIKIQSIVRDIRYNNRFRWARKEYTGTWPRLVPEDLWKRVQARYRPRAWHILFGYEWINGRRVINAEQALICKHVIQKYLKHEEPVSKILLDEGISRTLFYSILNDERRTGCISKDGRLVSSGYPEIISRKDYEKVQEILRSKRRWKAIRKKQEDKGSVTRAKVLSYISCYRPELREKIPEISRSYLDDIIQKMKRNKILQERRDGLLYFYGSPPCLKDFPMKLTREQKALKKIEDFMPAYRWQIREKLKLKKPLVTKYVDKWKKMKILKERQEDHLLQKSELPFPVRLVETRFKRASERRRKILSFIGKKGITKKELIHKTRFNAVTLNYHVQKLKTEGFLEETNGKLRILDSSVLSKLSTP